MPMVAPTQIKPLADKILIRPLEQEERTKGGIVLPDTAKEKPQMGKVLAVGSGRMLDNGERQPVAVTEGQTVLYSKYSGTEIAVEDEKLLLVAERDILAIVEG